MTSTHRATVAALAAVFLLQAVAAPNQRSKKKDPDFTQTLEVLPDPPLAIPAETARLGFLTAPLTAKGLLSQQTRDSLKALLAASRGAQFIKIRAFVAGTGDLRRVQAIVSEVFTERRLTLPVVSVVQVGALPMDGAQVQLEAVLQEKRPVNPHGLALISGQDSAGPEPVTVLVRQSVERLKQALTAASAAPDQMLRVGCFVTSLDGLATMRESVAQSFPKAQITIVQTQRLAERQVAECEGAARLTKAPASPVVLLNPEGLPASKNYSQLALVSAPRLIFAGDQLAFRYQESDARLAFQRLEKTMQAAGASLKNTVMLNIYPLSPQLAELVRKVRFEFLDQARPPASTMLPFEGLPSMDASFGLEAVAVAGPITSSVR
ncbi:MAG: RidA family protein [Bryobacterales bacterium]|nr:RidA family protein [Bryobacterales bacterium]